MRGLNIWLHKKKIAQIPKGVFIVYVHFNILFLFSCKDEGLKKDRIRLAKERREEKDKSQGELQVFYSVITVNNEICSFQNCLKHWPALEPCLIPSFPVAQMVEHGANNAKIMGSIPRESKSW